MLEFSQAGVSFDGQDVLRNFSLKVCPGALTVMLGPSGVGKTTLLRLAAGLIAPASGRVENHFRRTAMVFQEPRLLPWLSARENVALVLHDLPAEMRAGAAMRGLSRLGLSAAEQLRSPAELSGGQRQRVAIARAFAIRPDLILMDEPFSALDLGARRALQNETRALAEEAGCAVLFVTHDVPEAVRLADRILILSGAPGRLSADFAHQPVARQEEIWRAAADLVQMPALRGLVTEAPDWGRSDDGPTEDCCIFDRCEVNATLLRRAAASGKTT